MGQKSLNQNSNYWGVQIPNSAWKCHAGHECSWPLAHLLFDMWSKYGIFVYLFTCFKYVDYFAVHACFHANFEYVNTLWKHMRHDYIGACPLWLCQIDTLDGCCLIQPYTIVFLPCSIGDISLCWLFENILGSRISKYAHYSAYICISLFVYCTYYLSLHFVSLVDYTLACTLTLRS